MEKSEITDPTLYDAMLRSKGSSLRQVKHAWAEDQLVRYFNFQKMDMDPEISHQEMLEYYQSHEQDFFHGARVKWEEVMVRFDKFPSRDEAFQQIVTLGNEIAYGAALDAVAKRSSHGVTAHRGGAYDWTDKGTLLDKKMEQELFTLPVGYLSDLIESDQGVHIVRVIERQDAYHTPFRDAQVQIKEKLLNEKRDALIGEHLAKLRAEIPVEILWEPASPELLAEREKTNKK
jgi:parvulin-like peptidyl-prolyl isomerase